MRQSLIIEDDQDANEFLARLVQERDFEPIQSFTGEEGLQLARAMNPDIIFLDLMLPDLDGYKICEALKLDHETNPVPLVMVTALSDEEHRLRGFRVGADAYVTKPYSPEDIDRAIKAAFDHRAHLAQQDVELHLRFDLASEAENLRAVNELFGIMLRHTRLADKEIVQLRTALQEMAQNAIEWGNKYDPEKLVKITCHVCSDRIEINIQDEGEGFDPDNVPHAAVGKEDPIEHFSVRDVLGMREGGFGMVITGGLVDSIVYNETGNAVTIIKHFSS